MKQKTVNIVLILLLIVAVVLGCYNVLTINNWEAGNLKNKIDSVNTKVQSLCDTIQNINTNITTLTKNVEALDTTQTNKLNSFSNDLASIKKDIDLLKTKSNGGVNSEKAGTMWSAFSKSNLWSKIIVFLLIALILLPYTAVFFLKKILPNKIGKIAQDKDIKLTVNYRELKINDLIIEYILVRVLSSDRISSRLTPKNNEQQTGNSQVSLKPLESRVEKLEKLEERRKELEEKQKISQIPPKIPEPELKPAKQKLYLTNKRENAFSRTTADPKNCYFELFDIKENEGSYKFSGDEKETIARFNDVFDGVCEVVNSVTDATSVIPVADGKVKQENGKWIVVTKAKVKLTRG